MDSLGTRHAAVITTLIKYLISEAGDKKQIPSENLSTDKDAICGSMLNPLTQPNSSDCGLYVLHFAEVFLRKPLEVLERLAAVSTLAKSRLAARC